MKRQVLIIPLREVQKHFAKHARKDLKTVVASMLTPRDRKELLKRNKVPNRERKLSPSKHVWNHSDPHLANFVCESGDFIDPTRNARYRGCFSVSFATAGSLEDAHCHDGHCEIYFSEHSIAAEYRCPEDGESLRIELPKGGAIIFGPKVVHRMTVSGLTIIIEVPAVTGDRRVTSLADPGRAQAGSYLCVPY